MASSVIDPPAPVAGPRPRAARAGRGVHLPHVPALDGLRGLAVAGVLAFHAGHLRGGFLGVDLFFVLSGFLITGLLLAEWDRDGTIDLLAFWGRRFRRLLPALLVVLAAVAAYAAVALPATELGALRRDGLGTLAYVANWVAVGAGSDYWSAFESPSLLEHAWSLAIEEQFYVVWPLLAVLGLRLAGGRRRPLALATAALCSLSLVALWALHTPGADTSRAYYGTDSRAAAILYGALVALALTGRARRASAPGERAVAALALPAVVGLAVLWATTAGTSDALYGWGLPLAGISAAIVIAAVSGPRAAMLRGLLSLRALCWLGRISYGLYLWHWPVYVVLDEARVGVDGYALTALRVAVSTVLAVLSARLVERPIRAGALRARSWRLAAPLSGAAVAGALLVATTGAVERSGGVGERVSFAADAPTGGEAGSLLLIGDSQALVLAEPAPSEAGGFAVAADAVLGCGVGPGIATADSSAIAPDAFDDRCAGVVDAWVELVERERPDVVLLHAGAWDVLDRWVDGRVVRFGTAEWDAMTRTSLTTLLERLEVAGSDVVALTAACFAPVGAGGGPPERGEVARVQRWNEHLRAAASATGANVLEYGELLCPGGAYRAELDGTVLREDGVHLTEAGAAVVWRWLGSQLPELLTA